MYIYLHQAEDNLVVSPCGNFSIKLINCNVYFDFRSVEMDFINELQFKGVTGYRFEMDSKMYNYSEGHNQCFCKDNDLNNCSPNGTIDLTACYGSHFISLFLNMINNIYNNNMKCTQVRFCIDKNMLVQENPDISYLQGDKG